MEKAELHQAVDELCSGIRRRYLRALFHALIECGQIASITCAWSECIFLGQPLQPVGVKPHSASLDHIIATSDGGDDMPSNLQIVHYGCNMRKGAIFTDERRAKIGAAGKRRWANEEYRRSMTGRPVSDETRAKRSEAMKRHWADPERKAEHAAGLLRGDAHRAARGR